MKKILTVLLALSVVFTYTVGTAFAGTYEPVSNPEAYAKDMVSSAVESYAAKTATKYDKEAVDYAKSIATAAGLNVVNALFEEYDTNNDNYIDEGDQNSFFNDVEKWCTDSSGQVEQYDVLTVAYDKAATEKDFELKIAAAKATVEAVDPADYIEADQDKVKGYKEEVLAALDEVEAVNNTVKKLSFVGTGNFTALLGYADAINVYLYGAEKGFSTIHTADSTAKEWENAMWTGLFGALEKLTTLAEDEENSQITDAYVENIIANITYDAKAKEDGFYLTHRVSAGDSVVDSDKTDGFIEANGVKIYNVNVARAGKITAAEATAINNALMDQIEDLLSAVEVRIKAVADGSEAGKAILDGTSVKTWLSKQVGRYAKDQTFIKAMYKAMDAVDFYEDVVAYGEAMKDDVNYIGEKLYDDADIDAAIAAAKVEIYTKYWEKSYDQKVDSYFTDVHPIDDPVEVAMNAAIDKWQDKYTSATPEADRIYCANYYAPNPTKAPSSVDWQARYTEIKNNTIVALKEVKTIEEIEAIMADAADQLAELRTAEADNSILKAEIEKYEKALKEYAAEQWELVQTGDKYREESYLDGTITATNDARITSAYEAGLNILRAVIAVADFPSAYDDAKALFADIKTDAELKAEAKAVNEQAAALPATVTIEQEDLFMDANDAMDAYLANYGASVNDVIGYYHSLQRQMDTLKTLQQNAVSNAIRELSKLKPIGAEDKAAVQEVKDMYDRYYDYYSGAFTVNNISTLFTEDKNGRIDGGYLYDIYVDEVEVVKTMISKLTNQSAIEDIKAAMDAYDALSGGQQRMVEKAYPYKYQNLRSMLIDSVTSLKLVKNHSTAGKSNGKSWIRIEWSTVGDDAAVDGYEIYKSTKPNSGYKHSFTTKNPANKWYKNTAGLKKGTRYYYKVRAFVEIDGQKYYSDWSNKAYRIAK